MNYITKSNILLILLLVLVLIVRGWNSFQYPYYENDEGTYMSQAWSLIHQGELAPYTYWYDHAPGGWILIALWTVLTGGFYTFGFSVNSGRVLMLLLFVASSYILYKIVKKQVKGSDLAASVAVLFFALSPLAHFFGRRVLLDNMMVFWFLAAWFVLLHHKGKLTNVVLSATFCAWGILTKENLVFVAPGLLLLLWQNSVDRQRVMKLFFWVMVVGFWGMMYVLFAYVRGELFPSGTWLGGEGEHVSLIETLRYHSSRGQASVFDLEKSTFWKSFRLWMEKDPVSVIVGTFSSVVVLCLSIVKKKLRPLSVMILGTYGFFMRGGLILEFYVLALFPLWAVSFGVCVDWIRVRIKTLVDSSKVVGITAQALVVVLLVFIHAWSFSYSFGIAGSQNLFTSNQTLPQIQAVEWILEQESNQYVYAIDGYSWVDLNDRHQGSNRFEWYWKVDKDSDIRTDILEDDPTNIDFLAVTPQMSHDSVALPMISQAMAQSRPVSFFYNDGWSVDIWTNQNENSILDRSWEWYKDHFIVYGRVIDPYLDNITTSEGQAYALLRAVWMQDQEMFDEVLEWTENNLLLESGLYGWKWQPLDGGNQGVRDDGVAPDADQDAALALAFAYVEWGDQRYLDTASRLLDGIWNETVFLSDSGAPYLSAGDWAYQPTTITLNPSYLNPAYYRIFAQIDTDHDWISLIDSSYKVLEGCTEAELDLLVGVLPPEWCAVNKADDTFLQPDSTQPNDSFYGYNAFRIPWRVALDALWYDSPQSKEYLASLTVLEEKWKVSKKIMVAYRHDGQAWEEYESAASYGGNIGYFMIQDPEIAKEMYTEKLHAKFFESDFENYWEDADNYYTQNWAWFGTAMYSGVTKNMWNNQQR